MRRSWRFGWFLGGLLVALLVWQLLGCASTVAYDRPAGQFSHPTVQIENRSIDPYVVRYQGMRLGGTIMPGRTECVVLRGMTVGQIALELRPFGARASFPSWEFAPRDSKGWHLVIDNVSFSQGIAYITPAAPCSGKRARQED